jgi:hypothetical protein
VINKGNKMPGIIDVLDCLSQVRGFTTADSMGNRWLLSNSQLQQFAKLVIQQHEETKNEKN